MSWPWSKSSNASIGSPSSENHSNTTARSAAYTPFEFTLTSPYISIPITCASVLGLSFAYSRFLRRIPSAEFITPRTLERKRIRGYVTSIGDADGFRLYHRPGPWLVGLLYPVPKDKKLLKDRTISIRLAGVDAPECAHFGKPAQPYSAEAQAYLTSMVLSRNVQIELLSKDHYGRIVGMVWVRKPVFWPFRKNVNLEMLKRGFATVYAQSGAEYGSIGKDKLLAIEEKAKRKKIGMWSLKGSAYQSPAEYKRKHSG